MAQSDTLTIIGIGVAILFGALQMRTCNCYVPILLVVGSLIIAVGAIKFVWTSDCYTQFVAAIGIAAALFITWNLAVEAHRSARISDYIFIHERNGGNWDNGADKPNQSIALKEDGPPLRLAYSKQPARFTPVIQSLYDSLDQGTNVWITISGNDLQFFDDSIMEWRGSWNDRKNGNQYVGLIDTAIHHGKSKVGPNGIIKVIFPVGEHVIEYKIEGESRKGCSFSKVGHFTVQIYEDPKPKEST